jgi:hypothetical protein
MGWLLDVATLLLFVAGDDLGYVVQNHELGQTQSERFAL